MKQYSNIDEYIANFPQDIQNTLQKLRQTIQEVAPDASEKISYGIPTFTLNGNLVHFGAFKDHVGFFPGAAPIELFKDTLKDYETSKGTIQFPLDKPLPLVLIRKIVKLRVKQNQDKNKR